MKIQNIELLWFIGGIIWRRYQFQAGHHNVSWVQKEEGGQALCHRSREAWKTFGQCHQESGCVLAGHRRNWSFDLLDGK